MFWLAAGAFLVAGYLLYAVSEEVGLQGRPTPTKAGAEDDKGPELRRYVDKLYTKLRAQGLAWDEWGVNWRTVLVFYKDPVAEAMVKGALLLPERSVDLDGKFYHFEARNMKGALKTPAWVAEEEE